VNLDGNIVRCSIFQLSDFIKKPHGLSMGFFKIKSDYLVTALVSLAVLLFVPFLDVLFFLVFFFCALLEVCSVAAFLDAGLTAAFAENAPNITAKHNTNANLFMIVYFNFVTGSNLRL
jgi:hypothetical protein